MRRLIPVNTDLVGNSLCIKACYYKNAAWSTLTQWGIGDTSHFPVTGVMVVYED